MKARCDFGALDFRSLRYRTCELRNNNLENQIALTKVKSGRKVIEPARQAALVLTVSNRIDII